MAQYPPPGRMIDVGGRRLHLYELGHGTPTVVLESGLAATSLSWRIVQNEVAGFTRAISYDRAGLGWSDPSTAPPTISRLVDDLHGLISDAGRPPYLFVAHSFGAAIVRSYANRYREQVCGLVLVDPIRPEEWRSEERRRVLARGVRLSRRGAFLARIGVVGWCLRSLLAGSRFLPKVIGTTAGGRGMSVMNRLAGEVAKMPRELWPMVAEHWSAPKSFLAMAAQLEVLPEMSAPAPLDGLPVSVLTPGEGCGHWIQLDRPELVVQAVRDLVKLQRDRSAARQ